MCFCWESSEQYCDGSGKRRSDDCHNRKVLLYMKRRPIQGSVALRRLAMCNVSLCFIGTFMIKDA